MLYDGLPEAIATIRKRKGLSQEEAAERGGVKKHQWSLYETRAKRLGLPELSIITNGLRVTKTELWQEKYEAESPHYLAASDEVREQTPRYGIPMVTAALQSLFELDSERLPPEWRKMFEDYRAGVVASLNTDLNMSNHLKQLFWRLTTGERLNEARTSKTAKVPKTKKTEAC